MMSSNKCFNKFCNIFINAFQFACKWTHLKTLIIFMLPIYVFLFVKSVCKFLINYENNFFNVKKIWEVKGVIRNERKFSIDSRSIRLAVYLLLLDVFQPTTNCPFYIFLAQGHNSVPLRRVPMPNLPFNPLLNGQLPPLAHGFFSSLVCLAFYGLIDLATAGSHVAPRRAVGSIRPLQPPRPTAWPQHCLTAGDEILLPPPIGPMACQVMVLHDAGRAGRNWSCGDASADCE